MTNLILSVFAFMTMSACTEQQEQKPEPFNGEFNVMFYNVENLFDTVDDPATNDEEFLPQGEKKYTEKRYNKKLSDLSKVISEADPEALPAIIGLCEVENRMVVERLLGQEVFREKNYRIVHKDSPDGRGIDVALIYDADIFHIADEDFLEVKLPFAERPRTRDILYASAVNGSDTLHIFVNHWPSRYGGQEKSEPKRLKAAEVLREKVDKLKEANPTANLLIMGDFNDYPVNKSLTEVMGARADTTASLYNMLAPIHEAGEGTYNYRGEWGALDQFLVSTTMLQNEEGFTTSTGDVEVIKKEWMMYVNDSGEAYPNRTYGGPNYYGGYSDHLPILMRMELRQ